MFHAKNFTIMLEDVSPSGCVTRNSPQSPQNENMSYGRARLSEAWTYARPDSRAGVMKNIGMVELRPKAPTRR
jgi:hypothetical protein